LEKFSVENPANFQIGWALTALKADLKPLNLNEITLLPYTGIYGERTISIENGKLYYQKTGADRYQLTPVAEDVFMMKDMPYLRIKMIKENGQITGISRLYDEGSVVNDRRTGTLVNSTSTQ
jgi:hypothetical protein